jgi:hypothetical protein
MKWTGRDLREQLGVPDVADDVTATETEDDTCRPVLHLSDGRVASTNPDWSHKPGAERWLMEQGCEAQGCVCSPDAPCDETLCDGRQHDDGSTVLCTMCQRELDEMIGAGA